MTNHGAGCSPASDSHKFGSKWLCFRGNPAQLLATDATAVFHSQRSAGVIRTRIKETPPHQREGQKVPWLTWPRPVMRRKNLTLQTPLCRPSRSSRIRPPRTMKEPKQNKNETEAKSIMTKSERDSLLQIARQRARLAKIDTASYAAKLRADFEQQLDTCYPWDQDATWEAMAKLMEAAKREAASKIAARSRELGIPDWAAPGIGWYWYERGQNATKERRAELRRLAHRKIEAIEKNARATIERQSLEVQTRLFASALTSDAAKSFLDAMPPIESLMPRLDINTLESSIDSKGLRQG